jgi:hypothetical protein
VCMLNTKPLSVHVAQHTHTSSVSHQSDKQELSTRDAREHHIKAFLKQTLSHSHRQASLVRTQEHKNTRTATAVQSANSPQHWIKSHKITRRSRASKPTTSSSQKQNLYINKSSRSWSEV